MRTAFFARRQQVIVSISDAAFTVAGTVFAGLAIWFSPGPRCRQCSMPLPLPM